MRGLDTECGSRGREEFASRRGIGPCLMAVTLLLALHGAAVGDPARQTEYSDAELVAAALEVYNGFSDTPLPYLDSRQLERLADHGIVRVRKSIEASPDGSGRREEVVGMRIIEQPRRRVWLAALDPAFEASDLLTEVRLKQGDDGSSLWFQHLALPWPIADRYWVIRLYKDLELSRDTQDFVWEHAWDLADSGEAIAQRTVADGRAGDLSPKDLRGAVYVPLNRGAWVLFSLDVGRTLLAYRVSADVGGSIPESWIATFAMAQLDGLLEKVTRHAEVAWREYNPERYPIYDGAGKLLPASED